MIIIRLLVMLALTLSAVTLKAGTIRSIEASPKKMVPIYLKLGQSTILRFKSKPKKVVIGNSNYFKVEFIENDVTIQPQEDFQTNLFVYTENKTYGFTLVVSYSRHDDLVNVSKKRTNNKHHKKSFKKSKSTEVNKTFYVGSDLSFRVLKIQQNYRLNATIIDLDVCNLSKKVIKTKKISTRITRSDIYLNNQEHSFLDRLIKPEAKTKLRYVIKPIQTRGFSVSGSYKGKKNKMIVYRKHL